MSDSKPNPSSTVAEKEQARSRDLEKSLVKNSAELENSDSNIGSQIAQEISDLFSKNRLKEIREAEGALATTGQIFKEIGTPFVERSAGVLANQALMFAFTLGDLSSLSGLLNDLLKEINTVNNPNGPNCKVLPTAIISKDVPVIVELNDSAPPPSSIDIGEIVAGCFEKSSLYQAATSGDNSDALGVVTSIFNVISELTKPADPAECINPYFDQFFNLIPIKFIIAKYLRDLIKSALEGLSDQEVQEIVRDVQPCGRELTKIYTNELEIPEISFPLFKLPPIPTIPNINLYTVLNKIIVEAACFGICVALTPLTVWLSKIINDTLKEFMTQENVGAGSYTEFLNKSLGKIDLNKEIMNDALIQAIIQKKIGSYNLDLIKEIGPPPAGTKTNKDGFWTKPTNEQQQKVIKDYIALIRKYFKEIYSYKSAPFDKKIYDPIEKKYITSSATRELGTKEMIFLMLGEFNCFVIQDLLIIGNKPEYKKLRLDEEKRVIEFFKFIGSDIDPIQIVTDLKKEACPPDPCEEIDDEVIEQVQTRMSELCKVLDLEKSGIPPIPLNQILKTLKLDNLFNEGVKEQFKQLKTEQLLFLGFPSIVNYPYTSNITPFPPKENNDLKDYDLWNSGGVKDQVLFKNYFLRGGPPLKWKYDKVNINENLVGSTLEDVCGEEETFEETFIYILNDLFKIDFNKVLSTLEVKKEQYKVSFNERIQAEFKKRKQDEIVSSAILKIYEDDKKITRGGGDDDEEGLVSDFAGLYKTYKKSYDEQQEAKDRLRNWILGVRKDAGSGWEGINVFTFVDVDMGYGKGHAQKIYEQLDADNYDF